MSSRQAQYAVIGTRPPRYDAPDKVTGRALFGPDVNMPLTLHGKILRSPHPHARVRSIDTSRAEAFPGVCAVVTAQDLPAAQELLTRQDGNSADLKHLCDNTLAGDKVLYVGHPVAAVAANTPHVAEQALRLIEVTYEALSAVVDVLQAMRQDAPLLHEDMYTHSLAGMSPRPSNVAAHFQHLKGDPQQGFAQADVVVEREFRTATVHQGYIEPHSSLAVWGPDDTLTVYATTQGAFGTRDQLSELLRHPLSKIRVVPTEVGGAFGGKNTSYVDTAAALLSRKTGRPVKIVMTRAEVLLATGPAPGAVIRVKMGATREGRITAAQAELYYEAGAYPGSFVGSAAGTIFAPYDIPNGQIDGYDIVVNKPKMSTYRAPCATPASFAAEQVVDELAQQIGMDPLDFRVLNRAKEGTRLITGSVHTHIGSLQVLQAAQEHPHLGAPLGGPHRGRGIAFAYWGNWGAQSSSNISVNYDGTVNLLTGSVDVTGTRTSLAMQAAEALGVSVDEVTPSVGDTDSVGFTETSAGSRTTMATGQSVVMAARDVLRQMRQRAAMLWGVPLETVSYDRGAFATGRDTAQRLTFSQLAELLPQTGGPITGVGNVDVREWGGAFGLHIVDLEVDPETGQVTLLRYTAIQDVGTAVHPAEVEGQMQGGTVQGIGWALYEGYDYDEQAHLLNPTLLDYKMPTALDVPSIETVIVEVPYPKHPYGVRGAGEMPIVPPPGAIANAIQRAVGERVCQLPMTPARILHGMGLI